MKLTKLSLVAALAVSSAFAGGDIAPVEPVVAAPVENMTTISGKLTGYYITDDHAENRLIAPYDMFSSDGSQLGLAATLDVTHKFTDNVSANFSALGYLNTNRDPLFTYIGQYFESEANGALFNVANLTATYFDTTFVLGRQLLDTPMLGGFDWLLAPGAFEAYTAVNSSFENITLVGSYIRTWRPNNSGDTWINLTNIDDGNNWTLAAVYDNKTINGSIWYYNVDAGAAVNPDKYGQVYVDAGYNFGAAKLDAQYVNTNYDMVDDSNAYGVKISGDLSAFSLMAAYVYIDKETAGYIGRDGLYTSSWNTLALSTGNTFKVEAGTEFAGITGSLSYAYYEYEQNTLQEKDGYEVDLILGYDITDAIDLNVVYTNTDYGTFGGGDQNIVGNADDAVNALEVYANYKF